MKIDGHERGDDTVFAAQAAGVVRQGTEGIPLAGGGDVALPADRGGDSVAADTGGTVHRINKVHVVAFHELVPAFTGADLLQHLRYRLYGILFLWQNSP